jgi:integrase/recombinase XerD
MKKLLKIPDTGTKEGYRDRAILEIFYSTGIRRGELLNLKKEDIDYEGGYLRVNQGKGSKDRVVPLGRIACKYAENYIKGIRPWFVNSREIPELFVGKKGYKLSNSGLGEIIKKYAVKSEIPKPISPHTFRRTCATEMIKNNANLMHVKEMLGHSSTEATQIYCNLSITDLKKAHAKYHPREKDEK